MRFDTKQQLLFLFDSVFETFFPLVPLELIWVYAICLQPLIGEPHPIIRFLLLWYLILLVLKVLRGFLTRSLRLFGEGSLGGGREENIAPEGLFGFLLRRSIVCLVVTLTFSLFHLCVSLRFWCMPHFYFLWAIHPVLKVRFGPPNADFWSVWSSQKARKFWQIFCLSMISH